jgi:hypothetical protein
MSPEITTLVQQLRHFQAEERIDAANQLDPNVRISASQAFQRMKESASAAIPHLIPYASAYRLLKVLRPTGKPSKTVATISFLTEVHKVWQPC